MNKKYLKIVNLSVSENLAKFINKEFVKIKDPTIAIIPVICDTFKSKPYPISQNKCLISFTIWKLNDQHNDIIINLPKKDLIDIYPTTITLFTRTYYPKVVLNFYAGFLYPIV